MKNEDINLDEDQINFSVHLDDINKLETHIINPNDEKEMNKLSVKKLKNIINFDFNEERKKFEKMMADEI